MAPKFTFEPSEIFILILLWLASTAAQWSPLQAPKELAQNLVRDPVLLSEASTDYGHIVHENPVAVFKPSSVSDIAGLIKFSNSLPIPFTVAARGQAHSVHGQAMARDGVAVNMTELNDYRKGSGIVVKVSGKYADVGGEQIWIDVLHATLEYGLTPLSWTDYLYLTLGGTLSNAGISGQAFQFGPQISNVHELELVTGKGDIVTCSATKNSNLFYAVLGGLGQFGIITRARVALGPAPTRVKWLHLLYNDFSAFSGDQEHLISLAENAPDYVEGFLLLNQPPLDLSFYPAAVQPRITSLVTQYSIIYIIELVKYYDDQSQENVDQEVEDLVRGLKFVPRFMFEKDASYEEFLNRVHSDELVLRSQGLWDLPHPWLNIFVPKSRISDIDEGVFKGIILKQNLTAGLVLIYPMNRSKWDDRMSAVTPDEDVFYNVAFLHTSGFDQLKAFQAQNQEVLQFCEDAGIKYKQYLPQDKTKQEWKEYFGPKWKTFQERKAEFDPKHILAPGQGIFT
ncbi:hypothetical protein L6164_013953 [Bauhinia variegata]|uniref:Uncharacterized protein n=1 Tax=Bauhinia variegata TaxID=167791 RepID=A0ACB9NFN8_BAUVA|nr:hypothetical protein L6164_013953 [Bauhinia variegata]